MAINLDSPPIYDILTKNNKDYLTDNWQSWLGTFFQTVVQKFIFWNVITNNLTMQITNGYITNGLSPLILTLPLTSDIGDTIEITSFNANGWHIAQNSGQQIQVRNITTTLGSGGSLSSTSIGDSVRIMCTFQNLKWVVLSHEGTLTVV